MAFWDNFAERFRSWQGIIPSGKAVDGATYAPAMSANDVAPFVFDITTGGLITSGTAPVGGATAANQTSVQANAGSDASKAVAVQGVTGGKSIPITRASATDGTQLTRITDGTNTVAVTTVGADNQSLTVNRIEVESLLKGYDGTNCDLIRAGVTAATTTPVGYPNVIPEGVFATTLPVLTNGQFSPISLDAGARVQTINTSKTSGVTVSPTVSTSPAYSIGDVVGGLMTFAAVTDVSLSGVFHSIRVTCKSVQTNTLKFYLFRDNPSASTFTDNAAANINVADFNKLIGVWTLGAADSGLGTHTIWQSDSIGKAFTSVTSALYGVLINSAGTPTLAATTDISVTPNVLQD